MKKMFEVEQVKCVVFTIVYTKQNAEVKKNWGESYFEFLNAYNSYNNWALKFEMNQGGKDENGFYPNYMYIAVDETCADSKRDLLERYGFNFNEYHETINKIIIEDWDEYMIEYH